MLENFRKYSAFMVVVVALLAFGLIVTLQDSSGGAKAAQDVVTVNDQGISPRVYQNEVVAPLTFVQTTGNPFFRDIYELTFSPAIPGVENAEEALAIISLAAEQEAKRLGFFVSMKDVENFVQTDLFVTPDGSFDSATYSAFITNVIQDGMRKEENDFFKTLRRYMIIQKVAEVKNLGYFPSNIAAKQNDINTQTIKGQIYQIANTPFAGKSQPTEEEIKVFYEKEKDGAKYGTTSFFTKRKVRLTYIPVNLTAIPVADEKTTEVAIELLKSDQERNYSAYKNFLNDDLNDGVNKDIEGLAKKHNLAVKTTELVDIDGLSKYFPDFQLKGDLASKGSVYNYLFSPDASEMRRMAINVPGAHKQSFIHYRIDQVEEPRMMSFEESKTIAKKLLSDELDVKLRDEAAKKLQAEVKAKLEAGGKISEITIDAATVKVFKEEKFSPLTNTEGLVFVNNLFDDAKSLPFNSVSEVISDANYSSFIYVESRQVEKAADYKESEFLQRQQYSTYISKFGFGEWLLHYLDNAEVTSPSYTGNN
ncbi:SurA N-terminal domain-containing protein [Akkermansiaceae bacterium]|nr:SurA N-terminal domain-containing protein [Akkermansiaceae bacterium]